MTCQLKWRNSWIIVKTVLQLYPFYENHYKHKNSENFKVKGQKETHDANAN